MPPDKLQVRKEERVLTWITSTDLESRRRAKSHASTEIKRRKTTANARLSLLKRSDNYRTLVPVPVPSASTSTPAQFPDQIPSPVSLLGAGRVDPFTSYPVSLEFNEHLDLVDHFMFTAPSLGSKPQKRVCFLPLFQEVRRNAFELAQNDPAAFSVILAIASADKSTLQDKTPHIHAIEHSTKSLRLLRKRMIDRNDAIKDGTMATVALQVIYQLLFESCDSLEKHMDALEHLVEIRGGIEVIQDLNPKLALLINLADYLAPATALVGRRRFHTEVFANQQLRTLSPVALTPPKGLEALAHFDVYVDLKQLCFALHRATVSLSSGDLFTFSTTEFQLRSQLQDLFALGTSNLAWGRRCEIMKCVQLSALIYLKTISQADSYGENMEALQNLISASFPQLDMPTKVYACALLKQLLSSGDLDEVSVAESLAPLMRLGASMDGPSWFILRQRLQSLCENTYRKSLVPISRTGIDPQEVDISGLTALFGYFNLHHK